MLGRRMFSGGLVYSGRVVYSKCGQYVLVVSLPRKQSVQLRTISSPPPPSLPITRLHLHPPPLSVTPRAFHSKLKSHLFNHSYPDPSDHSPPHLNNTHHNSYSVPSWYS